LPPQANLQALNINPCCTSPLKPPS
jgi:hypothetical protein